MRIIVLFSLLVGLCLGFEDKSIYKYLLDNSYTSLTAALQTAGLASTLDGSGPYTIFAPTNDAFQQFNTSDKTKEQLATIFRYHVVNEFVLIPMIHQAVNKTTLETQNMTLQPYNGTILVNGKAWVLAPHNDIIVNNGVVQPIDHVLIPPVFVSHNIFQVLLREDTRFQDLTLALILSNLVSTLEVSEFTLFAPTNAAFERYKDNLLDPAAPNAQRIYQEVFKYHMIPGGRRSSQLKNGERLYTMHGTPVTIYIGTTIQVNNANVIDKDILASNGVVYAIDNLLIPQDIGQITG